MQSAIIFLCSNELYTKIESELQTILFELVGQKEQLMEEAKSVRGNFKATEEWLERTVRERDEYPQQFEVDP